MGMLTPESGVKGGNSIDPRGAVKLLLALPPKPDYRFVLVSATQIPIDWSDLEIAVERNAPNTESYLDRTTGHVVTIVQGEPEAAMLKQKVAENIGDFLRIEPASSREQYSWMERFVASVEDPALRQRLIISIDGKGAFRRFKDVLLAFPAERERWFTYRSDLLHWHIHTWLDDAGVTSPTEPPWGDVGPPAELREVATPQELSTTEPPGEALRRQARELIDTIPAIELPTAIAFLEFLTQRSNTAHTARTAHSQDSPCPVDDAISADSDPEPGAKTKKEPTHRLVAG